MSNKDIDVLIAGKLNPVLIELVEQNFNAHKLWEQPDQEAFLNANGAKIQGLVTSGVIGADKALMDKLPNLKVITSHGVGYDPIDTVEAKRRGIIVTNTPNVLNTCVADTGMALLLAVARRIVEADAYLRAGKWLEGRFPMATKVSGKACGVVGLGNIGKEFAKRAAAFDMAIHYYDPTPQPNLPYTRHESLLELAKNVDFLVLTLPGGKNTRHIINSEVLAALGSKGFLVNIARGTVVDEQALIHALQNNIIAGAGLDVFEFEPKVPQELISMTNVVLLPHVASSTTETFKAMADLTFANLCAFFEGRPVLTPVN